MRLTTARLALDPLCVEDAEAMVEVLGDPGMYVFIGGQPLSLDQLRARYRHLATGQPANGDEECRNWIVRRKVDALAVGTVQATIVPSSSLAEVAWMVGVPWQGQGFASEAARAVVRWLETRGTETITAHVHPIHHASARVASRAGLSPTDELEDGERVWRRFRRSSP
jgi:RimJ/RimL family protein N-acetyltransferase